MKGLRVHGLAARFAVTTLLLLLLMAGVEPNPGPTSSTGEGNHVSDRTDNNGDNRNLNDIDTASNTADSNTQQLFDRLLSAINHLARTVSQLGDKVGKFERSQNEFASHIDQRLGIMENAISTRLTDVEQNQNVLRLDIDALDYDFTHTHKTKQKRLTPLHSCRKKVDDEEAKVELLDTTQTQNPSLFWYSSFRRGDAGLMRSQSKRDDLSGHECTSACADRPSATGGFSHSCAVPVIRAARRSTEPQQRPERNRLLDIHLRGLHRNSETEAFWSNTLAELVS